MISYIILFSLIGLIFIIPKKYFEKYGIVLLMAILAIFFGIRNDVAVDDANYIIIFQRFSKSLEDATLYYTNLEMIFKIICRIVGILHMNYKAVFMLYSALSFTFLGLFLKKMNLTKGEILIFMMTFFAMAFFTYMTIMRQFLAITMALYGMALFLEKKYRTGIVLILISALFHNSTMVMIPLLPVFLNKVKLDYRIRIGLIMLVLILGKLGIINSIIGLLFSNLKYGHYIQEEVATAFGGSGITSYAFLVIYIIQSIVASKNTETEEQEKINNFLTKGQFIYFVIFFATINSGFAIRVSYLYLTFLCLLFVTFIRQVKEKRLRVIISVITCVLLIVISGKNMIEEKDSSFMENNFSIDFFNEERVK